MVGFVKRDGFFCPEVLYGYVRLLLHVVDAIFSQNSVDCLVDVVHKTSVTVSAYTGNRLQHTLIFLCGI